MNRHLHCPVCGTLLTLKQRQNDIVCCSVPCRDRHLGYDRGLQEPLSDEAEREANAEIAARKRQVRRMFDEHVKLRTPLDESPEAERSKRRELCGVSDTDDE